jgi:hypothetical protein
MDELLRYRGRVVTAAEVEAIRTLIDAHPQASRRQLSVLVCERWNWRQANGRLSDMLCRGLMLALERAGHLRLPPVRRQPPNNIIARARPAPVDVDNTPLRTSLAALAPLTMKQVRREPEERLVDALIAEHHYLGDVRAVGEQLKYLVTSAERPLACLTFSSAARHLAPRDRFIGWSSAARQQKLRYLAYNARFLILPWVEVPHLASHLLGRVARVIAEDWERLYGHPVYYLETFVEPVRYRGTCYRAANWRALGLTTGRGHNDRTNRVNRPLKEVWGYPLTARFRTMLGALG